MNPGTQQARLERALRQQHREAHGPTCECRAFEVEQVIAEKRIKVGKSKARL